MNKGYIKLKYSYLVFTKINFLSNFGQGTYLLDIIKQLSINESISFGRMIKNSQQKNLENNTGKSLITRELFVFCRVLIS